MKRTLPASVPFCAKKWSTVAIGSLLISLCLVSEAYYLVSSLWRHQYYFMYVYLTVCFLLMTYVASTVAVVQTYIALTVGDYRWQWRSFLLGFGVALHVFLVCAYFFFFVEKDSSTSLWMAYALWTMVLCVLIGMIAGTFSFLGSFFFVSKIYERAHLSKLK